MQGIFGDPKARVIRLERTQKKRPVVVVGLSIGAITTKLSGGSGTCPAEMPEYTWRWRFDGSCARGVGP